MPLYRKKISFFKNVVVFTNICFFFNIFSYAYGCSYCFFFHSPFPRKFWDPKFPVGEISTPEGRNFGSESWRKFGSQIFTFRDCRSLDRQVDKILDPKFLLSETVVVLDPKLDKNLDPKFSPSETVVVLDRHAVL